MGDPWAGIKSASTTETGEPLTDCERHHRRVGLEPALEIVSGLVGRFSKGGIL